MQSAECRQTTPNIKKHALTLTHSHSLAFFVAVRTAAAALDYTLLVVSRRPQQEQYKYTLYNRTAAALLVRINTTNAAAGVQRQKKASRVEVDHTSYDSTLCSSKQHLSRRKKYLVRVPFAVGRHASESNFVVSTYTTQNIYQVQVYYKN